MVSTNAKSLHLLLRTIKLNSQNNSIFNFKSASTTNATANSLQIIRNVSMTKSKSFEIKSSKKNQARPSSSAATASSPAATIPPPSFDGQPKEYSPKIKNLVDEIAKLNLIEVSDLNELLRKTLNIKDVAVSYAPAAAGAAGPGGANQKAEEEAEAEPAAPQAVKTSFKLKIIKYDESKKVALIKEIKALGENMNLVQAKKFVESVPQVFKDNISKDDAEKLKAQLEKSGAVVEIE